MSIDGQKNNVESVFGSWTENKSQKSSAWKLLEDVLSKVIFQIQPIKKSKLFQITNVSRVLQIGSILSVKHCY